MTQNEPVIPACGCTPSSPVCEQGRFLVAAMQAGYYFIESARFPNLSVRVRDGVLEDFQQAVNEYMQHCGYMPPGGMQDA
jgi:hypothetical protein